MWACWLNSAGGSNLRCSFRMESMLGPWACGVWVSTTALSAMMRTSTRRNFPRARKWGTRSQEFILHSAGRDVIRITDEEAVSYQSSGISLDPNPLRAYCRQFRLLPGIEAAYHNDHVLETGALQQAAGDHAAISTLAVNRYGHLVIHLWRRDSEIVERPPVRAVNVFGIPFGVGAAVSTLHAVGVRARGPW